MSDHAVHWHEGMFLTPQHFQAADRWQAELSQRGSQWDHHYNWGLHALELDQDALANQRLVIHRLQARLPDGTLLSLPEDATLPVVDLQTSLRNHEQVRIHLALPLEQANRSNTADDSQSLTARYLVQATDTTDENTGANAQSIEVRRPNVRLLVTGDDLAGYEVLPIAQISRSETSTGAPRLDPSYIPPLLSCDCWEALNQGILTKLQEQIEKKARSLASQAVARRVGFDSYGPGEQLMLEQLRALNEAYSVLAVDIAAQGVAPFSAYRELARLVGRLSVFGPQKRSTPLPIYNHDDLGGCFLVAQKTIEQLLHGVVEPGYQERIFTSAESLLRVTLEPSWLAPGSRLYLGVQSSLPVDEVEELLENGRNIKFGSEKRAESLYLLGQAGLQPERLQHTPQPLPVRKGLTYFALNADNAANEWQQVERSLSLAARLTEQLVVDELDEQDTVVLDIDGRSATMKLSLFVVNDAEPTSNPETTTADALPASV